MKLADLTFDQLCAIVRDQVRVAMDEAAHREADSWMTAALDLRPCSFSPSEVDRFWGKVNKLGPIPEARPDLGECWIWTAAKKDGYGRVKHGSATLMAHRVGYVLGSGLDLPKEKTIDHLCRVNACVRASHLEPCSILSNMRRADDNPSSINRMREYCANGHPFDEQNTRLMTQNGRPVRKCKACSSARYERHRDARRAAPRLPKPDRDTLASELDGTPFTALALKYGVSDVCVKKWAIGYGIEVPRRRAG